MAESNNQLQKYAMYFGTYMGAFWCIKFIAFPLSFAIPFLSLLFFVLTMAVPFLGYYYGKMYRKRVCGGYISFAQASFFVLFMYLFASLLAAVMHFVYFEFIDHGYVIEQYTQALNRIVSTPGVEFDKEMIDAILYNLSGLTSIDITMQFLSWDLFFGAILSLPTGLLIMKNKPAGLE